MGHNLTAKKETVYLSCAERLSGTDILCVSFSKEEALAAARKVILSLPENEKESIIFQLAEVSADVYSFDTPNSAYLRAISKAETARSARVKTTGIRDALRTELRVADNGCEFFKNGELLLVLTAPYPVGENGLLSLQDQIKADTCRIQRKANLAGCRLTRRELWHLAEDLAEYYTKRDQKKYTTKRGPDRYAQLRARTEQEKRAVMTSLLSGSRAKPWDADSIAAEVYEPFLESLYKEFPKLVVGSTLFERCQMLELLEDYRCTKVPFPGYGKLPQEAQVFTVPGGVYGSF